MFKLAIAAIIGFIAGGLVFHNNKEKTDKVISSMKALIAKLKSN